MITTEDVVRATGGVLLNGDMLISFNRVGHDSRQIKPGDLFVALKGPRFDGHDFVLQAIEAGAKGALVEYWPQNVNIFELHRAISIVKVPDTLKALGDLAAYWRKKLPAKVVGITGSCGKTTTKEFLKGLLERYGAYANPGNWNNLIGTPLSLLNAPPEASFIILELATNRPGEIPRLAELVNPEVSVLLGVEPAHLEGFSSYEGLLAEKLSLFEKTKGPIVYPFSQRDLRSLIEERYKGRPARTFGLEEGAYFRAQNVKITLKGTEFDLVAEGKRFSLRLPLLGRHFVLDLLAALAAASFLVEDWPSLLPQVANLKTLPRRLELKEGDGFWIVDDTYNANPASLRAGAEVVSALRPNFKRAIAVLGDMKELGSESEDLHRKAASFLVQVFDQLLVSGSEVRHLAEAAKEKAKYFPSKEDLIAHLKEELREGDLLYVKASRAMGFDEIVDRLLES